MKNMHALALCAILTPTFVLATGSAIAQEPRTTAEKQQTEAQIQRQNPPYTEREQPLTQRHDPQNLDNPEIHDIGLDSSQATLTSVDRSKSQAAIGTRAGHDTVSDKFLSTKPTRGIHADQLIGMEVKGQNDGDDLGTINDLIIDENGQVVAVVVGIGGFLGMGERDVAIGWDSLQRTARLDDDEDGFDYRFVATKDSLKNAPAYKRY